LQNDCKVSVSVRAAIQLKILIAINRSVKTFNRDYFGLIVPGQETQVYGIE